MKNIFAKLIIFLLLTLTLISVSCKKKNDRIPYVSVGVYINPNLAIYNSIKTPGNYLYLEEIDKDFNYNTNYGYAGIILYCLYPDIYKAYERNCPHNPFNKNSILDVDSTNLFMVCRDCGSKFSIIDGTQMSGPSKNAIVEYKTNLINDYTLYIYN